MPWMDEEDLAPTSPTHCEFDPQNAFDTFRDIVQSMVKHPAAFFRGMPIDGGFLNPTLFLLGCLLICGFLSTILRSTMWPLLRVPVLGLISILLCSVILYMLSGRLFAGKGTYEATYRVMAYAGVVFLIMWIPILYIFAFFFGLYLMVLGTQQVHLLDRSTSIASVVMSAAASLLLLMLFGFWRWVVGIPF